MLRKIFRWFFKKEYDALAVSLANAEKMITDANNTRVIAARRNFTTLEKCEIDSEHYIRTLKDVWETPAFQYELFSVKALIEGKLIESKSDSAVTIQGMFKGIDLLASAIQVNQQKWYQIQENKNAKIQYQGD